MMEGVLVFGSEELRAELVAMVRGRAAVVHADDALAASEWLRYQRWAAVVFEVTEDVLFAAMVLRELRVVAPTVPALVMLPEVSAAFVNLAQRHRAELLVRPVALLRVLNFVERALEGARGLTDGDDNAWRAELARRRHLTRREADLLSMVLERESREQVIQRWRVPPLVVHTELLSLLRKCGARNAEALAKSVLVNAVKFRADPNFDEHPVYFDEDEDDATAGDDAGLDRGRATRSNDPVVMGEPRRMTVLVVDDDWDAQAATVRTLRKSSVVTHVAASGEEALLVAVTARFDVILLAVGMKRMDGLETLQRLRADERTRSIPVVLMDRSGARERSELLAAGALGVVSKPFRAPYQAEDLRALVVGTSGRRSGGD